MRNLRPVLHDHPARASHLLNPLRLRLGIAPRQTHPENVHPSQRQRARVRRDGVAQRTVVILQDHITEHRRRREIVNEIRSQLPSVLSQKQVAAAMGMSRRLVDQLEISALWKIRMRMREETK